MNTGTNHPLPKYVNYMIRPDEFKPGPADKCWCVRSEKHGTIHAFFATAEDAAVWSVKANSRLENR